jgi:Ca2+-transporting ATPase
MITIHNVSEPDANDLSPFRGYKMKDWDVIAMKGAPDVVLELCSHYQTMDDDSKPLDEATRKRILAANDTLTKDALRVLGLAYRAEEDIPDNPENIKAEELEKDLVFVGLVGMIDPARKEVKPALEKAREAGIRTVMITGDYPNTARAIAETIHLLRPGKNVMTGAQLDETSDEDLKKVIEDTDVFARAPNTRCALWMHCKPTTKSLP